MRIQRRQNGFILLYVIVFFPLVTFGALILTHITRQMVIDTNRQTIRAQNQDLMLSAYQWAKMHSEQLQSAATGQIFKPDMQDMDIKHSNCVIWIRQSSDDNGYIEIEVTSTIGKQSLTSKKKFLLSCI